MNMELNMKFYFLFIGVLMHITVVASQDLEIVRAPADDVTVSGNDVTLTCRVEGDESKDVLEWTEFVTNTNGKRVWISNLSPEDVAPKYEILNKFDLMIKNVTVDDGGQYGCHLIFNVDNDYRTAEVHVFEPAMCSTMGEDLHEGDPGVISCHVPYGGNSQPEVEFFDNGHLVPKDVDTGMGYYGITANLTVQAEDDGKDYLCRVRLSDPEYSDSCTVALNVSYTVRNVTVQPFSDMYVIGDILECVAKGNPRPLTRWTQVYPNNDVINGSMLTLTPGMEGQHTWTCYAENTVLGNMTWMESNITFTVYTSSTPGASRGQIHGPSFIAVILAGILLKLRPLHVL